jgi:hypothetical protein
MISKKIKQEYGDLAMKIFYNLHPGCCPHQTELFPQWSVVAPRSGFCKASGQIKHLS